MGKRLRRTKCSPGWNGVLSLLGGGKSRLNKAEDQGVCHSLLVVPPTFSEHIHLSGVLETHSCLPHRTQEK